MTPTLVWICWGLVALGLIVVVAAVIPLSGRVRPLRRAMRRLSWRRAEVDRLRTRAESLQDQITELSAHAADLAQRARPVRDGHP
jgi:uncharacterized membrane protein YcjF (UPF0283 family)